MNGQGSGFTQARLLSKTTYFRIVLFATVFILVVFAYQTWGGSEGRTGGNIHVHVANSRKTQTNKDTQAERKGMITKVCQRNLVNPSIEDKSKFEHIIVNEKYKIMYCHVPKVACTNWKRVMLVLSGKLNVSEPYQISAADAHSKKNEKYLRSLDTYSSSEIKYRLSTYKKFMFVREPMERLLSAYRNKFTKKYNKYFHMRYGRKIIRNHRKNASEASLHTGNDAKFHEFIRYLLDPMRIDPLNDHWEFFYKLCCPCLVNYDFIGKYETLMEDAKHALHSFGVDGIVSFPENRYPGTPTTQLMKDAFKDVSEEEIHQLWRMYSVDYAMFGYSYPNFNN